MENASEVHNNPRRNLKLALYVVAALVLFLFSLELMVASVQHLNQEIADTILLATANPFVGLFIGLLITAILQSSSTTTALAVAFVISGSLTLQSAVPIIMGANVGTTITCMIVSLGFINRKKEFKRAVSAGALHVFFNLLTVVILFPLEFYYGFLSSLSSRITTYFFEPAKFSATQTIQDGWLDSFVRTLLNIVPTPFIISGFALILLFASILLFRKLISDLLKASSPEAFSRFIFFSSWKSFSWGLLTTAAIRSSTITTSVVVPIVAKKIATLTQAAPFVMGANVGTTITAFIAAAMHGHAHGAVSIAIAHLLFNFAGVLLFMPIPFLRSFLLNSSQWLGQLTIRYRFAGFAFLLFVFFLIPFALIYFNR